MAEAKTATHTGLTWEEVCADRRWRSVVGSVLVDQPKIIVHSRQDAEVSSGGVSGCRSGFGGSARPTQADLGR